MLRTRSELSALLGGRRSLERALREQTWWRVLRGVYAPAGTEDSLDLRAAAAALVLPAGAVLADRCLLWVLGCDVLPPGTPAVEAVVGRGEVVPRRRGVHVREALLAPGDRVVRRGLPCLREARAVIDLVRLLPRQEACVVADAALHGAVCTNEQLTEELARHASARGVVQAREVLRLSDPRAESPGESRTRLRLVDAGLHPVPQYVVRWPDGRVIARVDLAFPELKIAIEYDGHEVHTQQLAFARDRQRQNELVAAGWLVLRFTAADLRRPGTVESAVLSALRLATRAV